MITSEGVAASGANNWIAGGSTGSGVKVGVIDDGFGGLADAQADGELPTGSQVTTNSSNCEDATVSDVHGTAVAEVVHAMAPGASLYLACISDDMGFAPAVTWLEQQGVQVIDAGIAIPGAGRGDGTGIGPDSPAAVVEASNKAGVFWSVAAGDYARLHVSGTARADASQFVDFGPNDEADGFNVGAGQQATVTLRWDAWPTTTSELDLYVMRTSAAPTGPTDPNIVAESTVPQATTPGGGIPVQETTFTNTTGAAQTYFTYVKNINAPATMPFDLFVSGGGATQLSFYTAAGSIPEPASSPYVTAVGATQVGSGNLEDYSSQGPSVDARVKPDITGFDGVSTFTYGQQGFFGTAAASAHVAGAAALLKSANSKLDPAEIYATLTGRATAVSGGSPDGWGAGVLAMGPPGSAPSPAGSGYTPEPDPVRVLDTAKSIGGHNGTTFAPGEVFTLPLSSEIPGGTTAVAVTLSGTSDSATSVDVFPTNQAAASAANRASNLQLQPGGVGGSVTAIVPVGSDRAIRIRNRAGHTAIGIDLLGYFDPTGSGNYFPLAQPVRILDTRGAAQGTRATQATGHLTSGAVDSVQMEQKSGECGVVCPPHGPLPTNATAAVINLTAVEAAGNTTLAVYSASRSTPTQALAVAPGQRSSNLMIVPVASDGTIKVVDLGAPVNVIVDVVGWFAPGEGGRYVPLPQATRIIDTATGTGLVHGALGQGETTAFDVGGQAGVTPSATAAVLTVTGSADPQATQLSVSPQDVGFAPVTSIGIAQQQAVAGLVMPALGASGRLDIGNETGSARVQADVEGYFVGGQQVSGGAGNCVTPTAEAGYTPIFDGRVETRLEAWQSAGPGAVQWDGQCGLKTTTGTAGVTWYGGHTYGNDYTLELDWQATTANSGAGVLVGLPNPQGSAATAVSDSLEVAIGPGSATSSQQTGAIAGLQAPTSVPVNPVGQWNTFKITVSWNTVTVALNGQQVNQYTTTDPARINVPSFIGLLNSGSNDPVVFRDIRIKRNTPSSSGSFVQVSSQLCLDLANGVTTAGNPVDVSPCNGQIPQTWTMTGDGRFQVGNGCLDDSHGTTTNGNTVIFEPCNDSMEQQWVLRSDGSLVNVLARKCLTAAGTQGSQTVIADCTGAATQIWQAPSQHGSTSAYVTAGTTCLDVQNAIAANGTTVQGFGCRGNINQQWTAPGDGTLRAVGGCLSLAGGALTAGTAAQLWNCTGRPDQQWIQQADGMLINPASGLCLTAASSTNSAAVTITSCAATPLQIWAPTTQFAWRGQINGPAGKCAAANSSSGGITLLTCGAALGDVWTGYPGGTVGTACRCMGVAGSGTAAGTAVQLLACNGAADSQLWVSRPDGSLINPASDLVLYDLNGASADGTAIQIDGDVMNIYASSIGRVVGPPPASSQEWALPVASG